MRVHLAVDHSVKRLYILNHRQRDTKPEVEMININEIRKSLPTEARKNFDKFIKLGRYADSKKLWTAANKVHDMSDDIQNETKSILSHFGFSEGSVVSRFSEIVAKIHTEELSERRKVAMDEYRSYQNLLTKNGFYG
jgi:hypothetical protein